MDAKAPAREPPFPREMRVVGLTGGIASGKSVVAKAFEDLGAILLDADRAGHAALQSPDIVEAIRHRWGNAVFDADGKVSRIAVAKRVFDPVHGAEERAFLEQLTHPRIAELLGAQAEQDTQGQGDVQAHHGVLPGHQVAVLDAALLYEANWDRLCDLVVFVDTPRQTRMARALRRGWSETDFTNREAAQLSVNSKRERADEVIDNSGSLDYVHTQVERLWHALLEEK